ncbi:MAG: SSU ribosomal protein S8p (S15Ae), partial [uncultured Rubrobacteraceae bacterium]
DGYGSHSGFLDPHPQRPHGEAGRGPDPALEDEGGDSAHPPAGGLRAGGLRAGHRRGQAPRHRPEVRPRRQARHYGPQAHEPARSQGVPQADEHTPRARRARGGDTLDLAGGPDRPPGPPAGHRRRSLVLRLL